MASPIELLVQLKANRAKSDIDTYVNELRTKYQRNPLEIKINANSFDKVIDSAKKLQSELARVGTVSDDRLKAFSNAINGIANSSLSAEVKIMHLNRAMESIRNSSNNVRFNEKFADGVQRATAGLNGLETKLKSLEQNRNLKFNSQDISDANLRLTTLRNSLATVTNPTELQRLNRQFRELSSDINNLEGRSNSLGNAFQQAFTKFPVWILAVNTFYAPIRAIQDLTQKTIELDTALVSLSRVSDLSDFQLDQVLQKSIENVDILSAKTADYLELVNEFARTGRNDTESLALANTATILQNISDLDAKQAFDSLTAAQIAFNIEAEKSIEIADKLNEVDNNYSITTKDLSLSLNKAASTAATFGRLMPTWREISSIKTSHIGRTHWV